MSETIETDVVIVGAGPVGLFAVFELGLLDIKAHLVDILPKVGGQCAELYPEKPIYDIPGFPMVTGQGLIDNLMAQIEPFGPQFHLNEMVASLEALGTPDAPRFRLTTDAGTTFDCKAIVIAAGGGSFMPKESRTGGEHDALQMARRVHMPCGRWNAFRGQEGASSSGAAIFRTIDWTVNPPAGGGADHPDAPPRRLPRRARHGFNNDARASSPPATLDMTSGPESRARDGTRRRTSSRLIAPPRHGSTFEIPLRTLAAAVSFGLTMKLGPIADWGLNLAEQLVPVDTEKFETSTPGIFAIGDINTYPRQAQAHPLGLPRGGAGGPEDPPLRPPGQAAHLPVHDLLVEPPEEARRGGVSVALTGGGGSGAHANWAVPTARKRPLPVSPPHCG